TFSKLKRLHETQQSKISRLVKIMPPSLSTVMLFKLTDHPDVRFRYLSELNVLQFYKKGKKMVFTDIRSPKEAHYQVIEIVRQLENK
ncbi:MAG TPA: hypothetical protein VEA37_08875, partial [Flavobacterium sp.]|nr:hypothetical protein [Flavobacterium sp.]